MPLDSRHRSWVSLRCLGSIGCVPAATVGPDSFPRDRPNLASAHPLKRSNFAAETRPPLPDSDRTAAPGVTKDQETCWPDRLDTVRVRRPRATLRKGGRSIAMVLALVAGSEMLNHENSAYARGPIQALRKLRVQPSAVMSMPSRVLAACIRLASGATELCLGSEVVSLRGRTGARGIAIRARFSAARASHALHAEDTHHSRFS